MVLIRAGEAKSGRVFTQRALADIAAAADGLRCFADHPTALEDRLRPARSVRDIVGVFRTPRLVGNGGEPTRVEASLHVLEHADWLWQLVKEVVQLGERDVIGLSIDALCTLVTESRAGRTVQIVQSVPVLKSCDVVTRASAGGEFLAIEESATAGSRRRQRPNARAAGRLLLPTPETAHQHTANSRGGNEVNAQTTVADPGTPTERHEGHSTVREAAEQLACARILYDRLGTAHLPEPVKQKLRRSFEPPLEPDSAGSGRPYWQTRESFARDLDSAIVQEIEALDALRQYDAAAAGGAPRGLVSGHGAARGEMGHDGVSRGMVALQTAWDRLFGIRESEQDRAQLEQLGLAATNAVPRWTSLREAYVQTTGDSLVSGVYQPQLALVREANEVHHQHTQPSGVELDDQAPRPRLRRSAAGVAAFLHDLLRARLQGAGPGKDPRLRQSRHGQRGCGVPEPVVGRPQGELYARQARQPRRGHAGDHPERRLGSSAEDSDAPGRFGRNHDERVRLHHVDYRQPKDGGREEGVRW